MIVLLQSCAEIDHGLEASYSGQEEIYSKIKEEYTCTDHETPLYTQTEAYLKVPSLNHLVQKWYNNGELTDEDKDSELFKSYKNVRDSYSKYEKIINLALEREKKYANDFVFYHAFSSDLRIIQDLLKFLYEIENNTKVENFEFIRSYKSNDYKNLPPIDKWIDQTVEKYGRVHDYDMIAYMLSTNVSLFGNITRSNSNTWKYFIKSFSAKPPPLGLIFDEVLSKYISSTEQRAHINSILQNSKDLLPTEEGNLLQIFIPREIVNDVAYLSRARGYIYKEPVLSSVYSQKKARHQCISAVLDYMRNSPTEIGDAIDNFEARIIPRHEYFANPKSGIKIFRYTTLAPEAEAKYLNLIHKVAEFIIHNKN
jgi:hypothetical protein